MISRIIKHNSCKAGYRIRQRSPRREISRRNPKNTMRTRAKALRAIYIAMGETVEIKQTPE